MSDQKLRLDVEANTAGAKKNVEDLGKATGGLGDQAKAAGAGLGEAGKATEQAGAASEKAGKQTEEAGRKTKEAGVRAEEYGEKKKKAEQNTKAFTERTAHLVTALGGLAGAFKSAYGQISANVERLAGQGDKNAQAMVGQFKAIEKAMDRVVAVVLEGIVPAMVPFVDMIVEGIDALSKWLKETGAVQEGLAGLGEKVRELVPVLTGMVAGVQKLYEALSANEGVQKAADAVKWLISTVVEGWRLLGDTLKDGSLWSEPMALIYGFIGDIYKALGDLAKKVKENAGIFDAIFGADLTTQAFQAEKAFTATGKAWAKSAEEIREESNRTAAEIAKAARTSGDALKSHADAVEDAQRKYSRLGTSTGELKEQLEQQLAEVGDNRQKRLKILEQFYAKEVELGYSSDAFGLSLLRKINEEKRKLVEDGLKADGETRKRFADEQKKQLAADLQYQIATEGTTAAEKLEILQSFQERVHQLYEDDEAARTQFATQIALAEKAAAEESRKAVEQGLKDELAEREAARKEEQQIFAERLADLQLQAETEEELKDLTLEYLREVVEAEETSADLRKAAMLKLAAANRQTQTQIATDAKKAADDQAKAAAEAQKKVVDSYTAMFGLVKTAMTDWRAAIGQLLDMLTKHIIDSMAQQTAATVSSAATSSAAQSAKAATFAATQATESAAAAASIPPKVASGFAGLGPFGMALATAALAFFIGMAKKKIGLNTGGPVPGAGGDFDQVDVSGTPGEHMVNRRAMSQPGMRRFADGVNAGESPGAAAAAAGFAPAGSGGGAFDVRVSFVDTDKGEDRAFIRWIMSKINIEVLQRGGENIASHGNFKLPRSA
jgi:hypothetical protein